MDFKAYAKSASAFDGQITFWILPFTTPLQDTRHSRLDDIDPEWEYVSEKNGKVVTEIPDGYLKSMLKARDMKVASWERQTTYGGWKRRRRWYEQHDNFLIYDTHTVDVDFALADDAPAELRVFQAYWTDCADAPLNERFQAFQYAVSENVHKAWKVAFEATRDNPAPAAREMGEGKPDEETDPNATGDGEPSTTSTTDS